MLGCALDPGLHMLGRALHSGLHNKVASLLAIMASCGASQLNNHTRNYLQLKTNATTLCTKLVVNKTY